MQEEWIQLNQFDGIQMCQEVVNTHHYLIVTQIDSKSEQFLIQLGLAIVLPHWVNNDMRIRWAFWVMFSNSSDHIMLKSMHGQDRAENHHQILLDAKLQDLVHSHKIDFSLWWLLLQSRDNRMSARVFLRERPFIWWSKVIWTSDDQHVGVFISVPEEISISRVPTWCQSASTWYLGRS